MTNLALPDAPQLPAKLRKQLEKAVMAWLEHLEPHTSRSYRRGLVHFAEWLATLDAIQLPQAPKLRSPERQPWEDEAVTLAGRYLLGLKPPDPSLVVQSFLQDLVYPPTGAPAYTRTTAGSRLASLRWAVREAKRMGQINWNLEVDLPKVKKDRHGRLEGKPGRDMTGPSKAEARTLLETARENEDPRMHLLFSFLRYEGYREHEIRQINYEDVDLRRHTVTMVRKKRSEAKRYPLSSNTVDALKEWLQIRGREEGPLLYGGHHGTDPELRIGKTSIYYLITTVSKRVGVPTSPHKIRHRACTDIVQMGVKLGLPEEEILFLTGHSSRAALAPYYEASKSRKKARAVLNSLDELVEEDDDETT